MSFADSEQLEFFAIPSPCIGICNFDEKGHCKGCMRSRYERFNWINLTPDQQLHIIKLCRIRYTRKTSENSVDFFEKVEEFSRQMNIDDAIQQEFERTIFRGRPVDDLSRKALNVLFQIIEKFFLPILLSCLATVFMEESDFIRDFFKEKETTAEIKQGIKEHLFDQKYAKYRLIVATELEIKEHPDKRSKTLGINYLGAVIEVLEGDKQWLHVRTRIGDDDVVTGWVERRYTQQVRVTTFK